MHRDQHAEILPVGEILASHTDHQRMPHDAEFDAGAAFVIDRFVPVDRAGVPIDDLGFMRADAVYDVVTVSRGQFFRLSDHQNRFARSCAKVKLRNPFARDRESRILHSLVARAGLKDAYVWWCVTRGANPRNPLDRLNAERFSNRFYAFAVPYVFIKEDAGRKAGINLRVSEDRIRIPPGAVDPRAKNFCSLDLAMALFEAGESGADWAVLTDGKGYLAEAPGSNIFVVRDNVAATPSDGCLEGITRQTALDLCRRLDIETEVRPVRAEELFAADEAFLTSSAGGILPVSAVNGTRFAAAPGPVSRQIHNLYWESRWSGWHGEAVDYGAESGN